MILAAENRQAVNKSSSRRVKLADLGLWVSGGTPNRGLPENWTGEIPWFSPKDLKSFRLGDSQEGISIQASGQLRTLPPRTILVVVRGMILAHSFPVGITDRPATCNQDVKALIPHSEFDPEFLAYSLSAREQEILSIVDESSHGTKRVPTEEFFTLELWVPPLDEQRRIVEILSCWDQGITTLRKSIAKIGERLRWSSHKLLFGQIRASKFASENARRMMRSVSVPTDWQSVTISDIADEISERNTKDETLTVLSCTKHRGLVPSLEYFGKQVFSSDISKYKRVPRFHFAYATNHIEEGSIGYQEKYDDALISPIYSVFKTRTQVNDQFLLQLLKTETYRQFFSTATSASVDRRGSLRWKEFSKLPVALPSLVEQEFIATLLLEQKKELTVQQALVRELQQEKRALMQMLLGRNDQDGNKIDLKEV